MRQRGTARRLQDQLETTLRVAMSSITSVAPNSFIPAARSGRPTTAVTRAPDRAASCTAMVPTPPAAPVISTRLPSSGAPWRNVRKRGQAGDRQRRRLCETDIVGQHRHAMARHRDALRPAELVGQRHDACACRRAIAVLCLLQHDTAHVLAGHPSFAIVAHRAQFAAVEREGVNRDKRLVALRRGSGSSRSSTGPCRSV